MEIAYLIETVIKIVIIISVFSALAGIGTYFERKVLAFMQRRLGPMNVGPYGMLQFGADAIKLENRILAKEKAEKTQADSQEAVRLASRIVGDTAGDRTAVLEALNGIEDEEMRSKARKEAMYQVNQIETARVEDRAETFETAEGFIADNGSAESYKAAYPDEWAKLSPKQQKTLEKVQICLITLEKNSNH